MICNAIQNGETPAAHTFRIVRDSGTSFYSTMRYLDSERRYAMYAVYAFCRTVDDVADGIGSSADKIALLAEWREEIRCLYQGSPQTLIGRALLSTIETYGLDRRDFMSVIAGMEIDAAGHVRMKDMESLESYVDSVACAVGRLCTPIFGLELEPGHLLAKTLGEALQYTNILRDTEEDAKQDRLYLPISLLKGIDTADPVSALRNPACAKICENLADSALERFDESARVIGSLDRKATRAPRLMLAVYKRLLDKIIRRGWKGPHPRISLSLTEKLWIAVRYGWV